VSDKRGLSVLFVASLAAFHLSCLKAASKEKRQTNCPLALLLQNPKESKRKNNSVHIGTGKYPHSLDKLSKKALHLSKVVVRWGRETRSSFLECEMRMEKLTPSQVQKTSPQVKSH
jgi:hypothetical protein